MICSIDLRLYMKRVVAVPMIHNVRPPVFIFICYLFYIVDAVFSALILNVASRIFFSFLILSLVYLNDAPSFSFFLPSQLFMAVLSVSCLYMFMDSLYNVLCVLNLDSLYGSAYRVQTLVFNFE